MPRFSSEKALMVNVWERAMIGAPAIACTMRQVTTSPIEFDKPIMVEARVNATSEAMSSCFSPNRLASHGVGGVPMAPATIEAVTTQEI